MELIQEQCHEEIQTFVNCVEDFPYTWQTKCEEFKQRLNECSSKNPVIQAVNQACNKEFKVYDSCLRDNQSQPLQCVSVLNQFNSCAAKALEAYRGNTS